MDKDIIARNFSRCARLYDRYADIQMTAAAELVRLLPNKGVENILEIGCGTGNYTAVLRERFGSAGIKALDISKAMIEAAKGKPRQSDIEFIVADAESFCPDEKFDLITSNAAVQWFEDLDRAVSRYSDALTERGRMIFSTFGPETFRELRKVLGGDLRTASGDFLDKGALEAILKKHLSRIRIRKLMVKEVYRSLAELLRKIKYTGVRGNESRAFPLKKTEKLYKKMFGRVEATYEIYLCSGDRH